MRTEPLSTCERNFILQSFAEGQVRIDGRNCDEYRDVKVIVGSELGTCLTTIGKTKVFAQISCSIIEPRSTPRGYMGAVEVQVDMSPMGSPAYEDGRLGNQGVELTRILETLIRDSGVIDLEGLCLRVDKQVWQIRVDVHILDADGSLADCASIAALTALAHFRRPDVTIETDSIIIHTADQKMPISLNIYHVPICVTFGITSNGTVVCDPVAREELCLNGTIVIAANKRHEICTLHQTGNLVLQEAVIIRCIDRAIQRVVDITELIASVILDDNLKRSQRKSVPGFSQLILLDVLTSHECNPNELIVPALSLDSVPANGADENVVVTSDGIMHIGEPGTTAWFGDTAMESNENNGGHNEDDSEVMEQVNDIVKEHNLDLVSNAVEKAAQEEINEVDTLLDSIEEVLNVPTVAATDETASKTEEKQLSVSSGEPIQLSLALKKKKK